MLVEKDILNQAIGKKIKEARLKKRMSQEELCKIIGVVRSSLDNIENGRHSISVEIIYRTALALDGNIMNLLPEIDDVLLNEKGSELSRYFSSEQDLRSVLSLFANHRIEDED